jgi:3-dehydroquinate synthase
MLPVMARDKKVSHGKLRFILPTRLGQVELVEGVAREAVGEAIGACRG